MHPLHIAKGKYNSLREGIKFRSKFTSKKSVDQSVYDGEKMVYEKKSNKDYTSLYRRLHIRNFTNHTGYNSHIAYRLVYDYKV